MTMRRTILSTVFIPARCTLNLGGGSYRYTLDCGHTEYRWASKRPKGTTITCKTCAGEQPVHR